LTAVHRNWLRASVLAAASVGLIVFAGALAAGVAGIVIAAAAIAGVTWAASLLSGRVALAAMRARPVSEVEYPQLYRAVREVSNSARLPVPRVYVSPARQPNSFVTGRSRRSAAVCCTEGMLRALSADELRGVLGHELAHVREGDIVATSWSAGLAAVITSLGGVLTMLVLGPVAALLLQLSVSREREYRADALGARLAGDPLALARALRKIEAGTVEMPLLPTGPLASASHLMIVNPFTGEGFARLFSTHPPTGERVYRLEALAGYPR
jgi:heat shock protein HtpX